VREGDRFLVSVANVKNEWGIPPFLHTSCCIRCGPDEERILDVVPREDGARNSGLDGE
jgi:hypothetical protein